MTARAPLSFLQIDLAGYRHGRISEASLAARGLWVELMTLAHETGDVTHVPARASYLARQCGSTVAEVEPLLAELEQIGSIVRDGDTWHLYGTEAIHEQLLRRREQGRERKRRFDERKRAGDTPTAQAAAADDGLPTATDLAKLVGEACDGTGGTTAEYLQVLRLADDVAAAAREAGTASPKLEGHLTNTVIAHAAARHMDGRITGPQLPSLFKLAGQIGPEPVLWALAECASVSDLEAGKECRYVLKVARSKAEGLAR